MFDEVKAQLGPEVADLLTRKFLERGEVLRRRLKELLEAGCERYGSEAHAVAHELVTNAGSLGLEDLHALAVTVETAVKRGGTAGRAELEALDAALARAMAQLSSAPGAGS